MLFAFRLIAVDTLLTCSMSSHSDTSVRAGIFFKCFWVGEPLLRILLQTLVLGARASLKRFLIGFH